MEHALIIKVSIHEGDISRDGKHICFMLEEFIFEDNWVILFQYQVKQENISLYCFNHTIFLSLSLKHFVH